MTGNWVPKYKTSIRGNHIIKIDYSKKKYNLRTFVSQRSHVDYPGRSRLQNSGQQQECKQKMTQMVGCQVKFDSVLRQRFRTHHYTCEQIVSTHIIDLIFGYQ